ncbi:MAG: tetratricopeptide repeat protein [Candidatus Magasanikbacteria bacterium]|nr:tetratricopeptide repeat protein [Candidatus Magasanikbacteria bacterium]
MHRKIELLIKGLIGASFIMPLIVIPSSYIFPFIVPKIVFFRTLVLIMLAACIILYATNFKKYKTEFTPINIIVGLFFISFAISTFIGVDWYRSFWDNHERMLGLFTIFHYVVFYYIVTTFIKEWKDWKWLLRLFLFTGSIVMVIGFWQKLVNPEFLLNQGSGRVSSTLGNAIYYSGFGLFLAAIGYILAIKEKINTEWWWYAVVGAVIGLLGMFLGGTRGTFLGFLFGLMVLIISYLFTIRGHKKVKQVLAGIMIIGVIVIGIMYIYRDTDFVRDFPALGRVVNISLSGGGVETRLMAWDIAVEAWKENPVLGWGPNNFYYAFNKYYRPEFLEYGYQETWFDNAHSAVLNTLAVQGLVGLIFYLGLFAIPLYYTWRSYKKDKIDGHSLGIISAFLVAHFIHNAFVFENPTSYLYFFLFLAFVNSRVSNEKKEVEASKPISIGLSVTVSLIILLLIYSTNYYPAKANKMNLNVIRGLYSGADIVSLYNEASEVPTPHIDDIRNDFARTSAQVLPSYFQGGQAQAGMKIFDLAYDELNKNFLLHPADIRIHIQRTQLSLLGAQIKQDKSYLLDGERMLEEALEYSPKRQQTHYMLSIIKVELGKTDEAIALLQDTIEDNPKVGEGWWRLAVIYRDSGNLEEAKNVLREAEEYGARFKKQGQNIKNEILSTPDPEEIDTN